MTVDPIFPMGSAIFVRERERDRSAWLHPQILPKYTHLIRQSKTQLLGGQITPNLATPHCFVYNQDMEEDGAPDEANFPLAMEIDELFEVPIENAVETFELLETQTAEIILAPTAAAAVKTVRCNSSRGQKRWKKRKPVSEGIVEVKKDNGEKTKKQPNHFFAVRVSNCQIIDTVIAIQDAIVKKKPQLKSALISPTTLHITLAVAHLSCEEELTKARQSLKEAAQNFYNETHSCFPFTLHLSSVHHFNNKVVYARVHDEGVTQLSSLSRLLRDHCRVAGLTLIDDDDSFTPHMTLLKLSKDPRLRRKGIKSVGQHLYESHIECSFGQQIVESVQLLSMTDPKDDYGYYALKGEFHFGKKTMKSASQVSALTRDETRSRMQELLLGLAPGPSS